MDGAEDGLLRIGEVSQRTGISDQAIRYYERLGLLRPAGRTEGGERRYDPSVLRRLGAIKRAQALGFSLAEVRALLSPQVKEDEQCLRARACLDRRLRALETEQALAAQHAREVSRLRHTCEECTGTCRLEEDLEPHFP